MWIVWTGNGDGHGFDTKEDMLCFLYDMDYRHEITDEWYIEFDYMDRNMANKVYPVSDFI